MTVKYDFSKSVRQKFNRSDASFKYLARNSAMCHRLRRAVAQLESGKGKARRLIKR